MFTLAVTALTILCLVLSILFLPSIKIKKFTISTYWIIACLGALVLISLDCIDIREIGRGLTAKNTINPIKILILFLSMTVQSIFLDEIGVFRYCANAVLGKSGGNQYKLFTYLFIAVSVLTVFTSNDIIILTFTPFICYFSKNAKINPIPYLFTEFVAANTWSMGLIIGNPTNVYLASSNGITFIEYLKVMALPTIFGGVSAFVILFLIFRKNFSKPMSAEKDDFHIKDKVLLIIGVGHLSLCTLLLVASSYIGFEMWHITLGFALSLFISSFVYLMVTKKDAKILLRCVKRMPWELVPFVISMFIFVLCFEKAGYSESFGNMIGDSNFILKEGVASFLIANLVNNIPMSVLFSSMLKGLPAANLYEGVYAAIIGSNIGAFFTPIGALAGIMWSGILKKHEVEFKFPSYLKYGALVSIPTLLATLLGLKIVL